MRYSYRFYTPSNDVSLSKNVKMFALSVNLKHMLFNRYFIYNFINDLELGSQ